MQGQQFAKFMKKLHITVFEQGICLYMDSISERLVS